MTKLATDIDGAIQVAVEAAQAGGRVLRKYYQEGIYATRFKADTSLQTTADLEAEQIVIERIRSRFPEHQITAEEQGCLFCSSPSPYRWLIDALDGTENFVMGIPYFSTSLALCRENELILAVVYHPLTNMLYTAQKGRGARLNGKMIHVSAKEHLRESSVFFIPDFVTKRTPQALYLRQQLHLLCRRMLDTWSPALDWCLVAGGAAEGVIALSSHPLQPDAGLLILQEAGGTITDFQGRPFEAGQSGQIIGSGTECLHRELLQLARESC